MVVKWNYDHSLDELERFYEKFDIPLHNVGMRLTIRKKLRLMRLFEKWNV